MDGARLACWEAGPETGEPVLMLHGYLGSHQAWRHQIGPLAAAGCHVVAPDWFGWGASELAPDARFERDVERIGKIADALGWSRLTLFGHDYGGFIGLGFAQAYAVRVSRLAILNSRAHGTFRPAWYAMFGLTGLLASLRLGRLLLRALPVVALHRLATHRERRRGIISTAAMASYTRRLDARTLAHVFRDYRLPPRRELRSGLVRIMCPTSILWGARDPYLSPSIAQELAEHVPASRLVLFEDAGHFVMEERPTEVTDALRALLARPSCSPRAGRGQLGRV